ncbi:MAG: hypothetical protein ACKO96_10210, partial [Flammeovirgaceae bacterium]
SFFSSIASARDSEEVKAIIQNFALPTGSARIKRVSRFNVSLNAYVGIYGGWEKIQGLENKFNFNSYGVAAPVGISICKGHSLFLINTKAEWSTSLFISVIDIGAITAF